MPTPAISSGATKDGYADAVSASTANHTRDAGWSTRPTNSSGRSPMRGASSPAIGATTIGAAVHGSVRIPASSGL